MEEYKSKIKAVWVQPWDNEEGAPKRRIIHGRYFKFRSKAKNVKLGTKLALGYMKCGSHDDVDWIEDMAIYKDINGKLKLINRVTGLERPKNDTEIKWFDIGDAIDTLVVLVRKSGVDKWWPCYNLAETSMEIQYDIDDLKKRPNRVLHDVTYEPDLDMLKFQKIEVKKTSYSVNYLSPYYNIGLRLKSLGSLHFSIDGFGKNKTYENVLNVKGMLAKADDDDYTQGMLINPTVGRTSAGYLNYELIGKTKVYDNKLTYEVNDENNGLSILTTFEMLNDSFIIYSKVDVKQDINLMDYATFKFCTDSTQSILTLLGIVEKDGEAGNVKLPCTANLSSFGQMTIDGVGEVMIRFDSIRPKNLNHLEFKVGCVREEDGTYTIKKGLHEGSFKLKIGYKNHIELKDETPEVVKEVFHKFLYTSLTFRADTNTYSNNGNSMDAPICADHWADLTHMIPKSDAGIDPLYFMRSTLEKSLLGAPGYASGLNPSTGKYFEDEYIMSGTAIFTAIARFLQTSNDKEWFMEYKDRIYDMINKMKERDVDDDGIVESIIRKGNTGSHHWSTNWYDVISYGYKDAFSNAILYEGLSIFEEVFETFGETQKFDEVSKWRLKFKDSFNAQFMTDNGWFAGWVSVDGVLHDYGFLALNGLAVYAGIIEGEAAKKSMKNLWNALMEKSFDGFDMGLPGNIYPIDYDDLAKIQQNFPFGGYEDGGVTLSQAKHFINGLSKVGMKEERDLLLTNICEGLMSGNIIGSVSSGIDWKTWDGIASGYEGFLTEQLGIFYPLIKRFGKK